MKKMSRILLNMHLAESYAQYLPNRELRTTIKDMDSLSRFQQMVLRDNGVGEAEFRRSVWYYNQHTEKMDSIYQMILTEITILSAGKVK